MAEITAICISVLREHTYDEDCSRLTCDCDVVESDEEWSITPEQWLEHLREIEKAHEHDRAVLPSGHRDGGSSA